MIIEAYVALKLLKFMLLSPLPCYTPSLFQSFYLPPANKCIGLCLENIQKCGEDLTVIEKVEMLVTLFCFLKDSSEVSQMILDDFRSFNGYGYISEFLLRLALLFFDNNFTFKYNRFFFFFIN